MAFNKLSWTTPESTVANILTGITASVVIQAYNPDQPNDNITYQLISGTLPTGMSLSASGVLSGTPVWPAASSGTFTTVTYPFVVRARSSNTAITPIDGNFSVILTNSVNTSITWITPSGVLGTVPNNEFYSLPLQVVTTPGVTVSYKFLSGQLPPGMQVVAAGTLQGVPTLTDAVSVSDIQEFRFTIRATSSVGKISDRAFSIKVSSVVAPVVTPTTEYLGQIFDGTYYAQQLNLTSADPSPTVTWTILNGTLPPGVSLSSTGLVSGYIQPIELDGAFGPSGYDGTTFTGGVITEQQRYAFGPYDFDAINQSLSYKFTVQAFDGANYDLQTYQLDVVARSSFTADNSNVTVDTTFLTVDQTNIYNPVLLDLSTTLPLGRQASNYAYKFQGYDYQGDTLTYSLYNTIGAFDAFVDPSDKGFDYLPFDDYTPAVGGLVTLTAPTWTPFTNTTNPYIYYTPNPAIIGDTYNVTGNVFGTTFLDASVQANITFAFTGNTYSIATPSTLPGLGLDSTTGWVYGKIKPQTSSLATYRFGIIVSKVRDGITYSSTPKLFNLPVLGSVNNTITWITPSNLGSINNGSISELSISAESVTGLGVTYELYDAPGVSVRLPQGLELLPSGNISGRVSFETFGLDNYTTTFDNSTMTIDNAFTFTVKATTTDLSTSSTKEFTIKVNTINTKPYDSLYLKALPTIEQRTLYNNIINDTSIFDPAVIYRPTDPWFGKSNELKILFMAGLNPDELAAYQTAMVNNHFNKTYNFGDIKTAVVLDEFFEVKYEVVYIDVIDPGEISDTSGPGLSINLSTRNANPYIDENGNTYFTAYPNSTQNMLRRIEAGVGYSDKNALPDWMLSNQQDPNDPTKFQAPLGFTKGVVVAYTIPGASKKIAYKLSNVGFNFTDIPFTVDRYLLDNYYSTNFDSNTGAYISGRETTFDQVPSNVTGRLVATVNYAVQVPFDSIHGKSVDDLIARGGIDGITYFRDGETLVFAKQENFAPARPNDGWSIYSTGYFGDENTSGAIEGYDAEPYETLTTIPGYLELQQKETPVQTVSVNSVTVYPSNNLIGVSSTAGIVSGSEIIFTAPGAAGVVYAPSNPLAIPIILNSTYNFGNVFAGNAFYRTYYVSNVVDSTHIELGVGVNPTLSNATIPAGSTVTGYVFANQRGGVWQINIRENTVFLEFKQTVEVNQRVGVINGKSYGGAVLVYSGTAVAGQSVPSYILYKYDPSQSIQRTTFNNDTTKFFSYRDQFYQPGSNDKYVKFPQYGVFT
jgi:hypothetical protein